MAAAARPEPTLPPWNDPQAVPYVRIERVTKKFGDFVAVNDVSLKIYKKELFCLLGGSGCGKTTLLRMLAGFEEPTSGKIFIDGADMTGIPPLRAPGEHDVPVLRAVPAHDGRAERRLRPEAGSHARRRRSPSASPTCSTS